MIVDFKEVLERVAAMRDRMLRLLVVSACTGQKRMPPRGVEPLTMADLQGDWVVLQSKAERLAQHRHRAEELYRGQAHTKLMIGVSAYRSECGPLDLRIMSAGFGVVRSDAYVTPYEATFAGMHKTALRSWADKLLIPRHFASLMQRTDDLKSVAVGSDYLEAASYDFAQLGGTTILLCSHRYAEKLPASNQLLVVPLGNAEGRRFRYPVVRLKSALAAQLLLVLAARDSHKREPVAICP